MRRASRATDFEVTAGVALAGRGGRGQLAVGWAVVAVLPLIAGLLVWVHP